MEKEEIQIKRLSGQKTVYISREIDLESLAQLKRDLRDIEDEDAEVISGNARNLSEISQSLGECYKDTVEAEPVVIDITSPGGCAYCGLAMYDAIREFMSGSRRKVVTKASGLVASAATIVLLAADERVCSKNASFMIHSVGSASIGKLQDLEDDLEETKRLAGVLKRIYTSRTGISQERLAETDKLKKDWVLDAEEAVSYKIVTKVL